MKQVEHFKFKTQGAGGDDIVEGYDLAIEVWGKEACSDREGGSKAFAYLWRRFGPPWHGCDNHKDLVGYHLTTPDSNVFLWIHLNESGLKYSVGYTANVKLRDEMNAPIIEWENIFKDWWWKQQEPKHPEWVAWKKWTKKRKEEVGHLYWEDRMKKTVIRQAAKAIGKFPKRVYTHLDGWKNQPEGSVIRRVNEALVVAMTDLLRPVYIRDVPINILGHYPPNAVEGRENEAQRSKYAGYGLGDARKHLDEMIAEDIAKYGKCYVED